MGDDVGCFFRSGPSELVSTVLDAGPQTIQNLEIVILLALLNIPLLGKGNMITLSSGGRLWPQWSDFIVSAQLSLWYQW